MKLAERLLFLCHDYAVMLYCFMGAAGGICLMRGKRVLGYSLLAPILVFYTCFGVMLLLNRKEESGSK